MPYDALDGILCLLAKRLPDREIAERVGTDEESIRYVQEIRELSRSYREPPLSVS